MRLLYWFLSGSLHIDRCMHIDRLLQVAYWQHILTAVIKVWRTWRYL